MKNKIADDKLKSYKASRGMEREQALANGEVWTRPTMYMEDKKKYNRNRQKDNVRKEIQEY